MAGRRIRVAFGGCAAVAGGLAACGRSRHAGVLRRLDRRSAHGHVGRARGPAIGRGGWGELGLGRDGRRGGDDGGDVSRVFRGGVVAGAGPVDLRIDGERVVEVGAGLVVAPGDDVVDAAGARSSPASTTTTSTSAPRGHHGRLDPGRAARSPQSGATGRPPRRCSPGPAPGKLGSGHRAVPQVPVAGDLDRWALDRLAGPSDVPVRIQHRSGAQWILNSAGIASLGLEYTEGPSGVERDGDGRPSRADLLARRSLARRPAPRRWPTTGASERTRPPSASPGSPMPPRARGRGIGRPGHRQRDRCHPPAPAPDGSGRHRSARGPEGDARPRGGPARRPRPAAPRRPDLNDPGRPHGRPEVAVDCVTLVQATWAVAAFEGAGPTTGSRRDRIEHGAVLSPAVIEHIRALGLTVVTNPASWPPEETSTSPMSIRRIRPICGWPSRCSTPACP